VRTAALAIAWEFRQRHRRGLIALACYLVVLVVVRIVLGGQRVTYDDAESFAWAVIVPMTATFMYFLAIFTFGLAGDIGARESMYPRRMFTLPLTASALAGWPMLYGSIAMMGLWLATRFLGLWPSGVDVPVFWPLLLAPSLLAWTQALVWMSYPLPGMRAIVTVLWLMCIDTIVLVALELKASEAVMIAIIAPHVPLAFLVARFAVARARRGDVPHWSGLRQRKLPLFERGGIAAAARTPARAQRWFEWRLHGRSLPFLVAILLPFELGLLFVFKETQVIVFETLFLALTTPPLMATFVAATVSTSGLTPFVTTRPLSNGSLIAAKLKVTMQSTLVAWLLVLIAIPIALRWSGTHAMVLDWMRQLIEIVGTPRAIVMVLLALAMLIAETWKQLVQSLCIGMTGREWLIKGSLFAMLAIIVILGPLAQWVTSDENVWGAVWSGIPWFLAVLVCIKVAAAMWIAVRLDDHRLLLIGAIVWNASVLALYGVLVWIFPTVILRHYLLAFIAILAVPLTRLAAAPLALAWNRHR
jgi:hypothetical protein